MVNLQQLQNAQHNVVDIAEARSLSLLGMMHATCIADALAEASTLELHGPWLGKKFLMRCEHDAPADRWQVVPCRPADTQ